MSLDGNEFVDDGVDTDTADTGKSEGGGLRNQLKAALARVATLEKERNDAAARAAELEASSVFTRLGVPDKVRTLYKGDPTEEAITKWVTDYADVFGLDADAGAADDAEQKEAAEDLQKVQGASTKGVAGAAASKFASFDNLKAKGSNPDAVVSALIEAGFTSGGIEIPRELT